MMARFYTRLKHKCRQKVRCTRKCYSTTVPNKKLSYRRVTARCVLSVVILPITTQQYRNYLYDKS